MKRAIRKWLGIDDLEKKITAPISQDALRLEIGQAFNDALNGREDSPWCGIFSRYQIPNALEQALNRASRKTASEVAAAHVESRIATEAFIDEVVARIQRKQLG